jgi:hypothetical protein
MLNALPYTLQGNENSFCYVFEPVGQISTFSPDPLKLGIVTGTVLPVVLIHRENVMRIKPAPVKLPQSQCASRSAIAIGERMNSLKPIMQNGGTQNRRQLSGMLVPPLQQFKHQAGHIFGIWWNIGTHADPDCTITACLTLIHDVSGDDSVQCQYMLMVEWMFLNVFLDEPESGKIVYDFSLGAGIHGSQFEAFLHGPNLFQGQRIALYRC